MQAIPPRAILRCNVPYNRTEVVQRENAGAMETALLRSPQQGTSGLAFQPLKMTKSIETPITRKRVPK
jgi:hypothetical protein